ncbi:gag protein [Paraphaeosphaeria minitans]|uniref:Gag protein n=1 Tax=Paraphaeosphaeria minitans TaxID=565426 RepID=A0A9P6G3Z7_9PLEO|nr:gag protein [Paraphaeosphaeria minitans]
MAQQPYRDPTVTLRDHTDYTGWITQLQARCVAHNIWDKVNPTATNPLITKPNDRHEFEKEQASLQHIVAFIQSTVSPHLLRTCCLPEKSLRQWIADLKLTVGVDEQIEQERARDRYLAALRPMRSASQWDTWLAEYDQAATEAETYRVAELSQLNVITKDFLAAGNKVAPIWSTNFQDNGRFAAGMSRKEMMKRFREHMMTFYPLRSGKHKAAFVSDNASYLAEGGATTQSNDRDASHVESAPSNRNRGRPRNQRTAGKKDAKLKRPSDQGPATTGGAKCPACGQRHSIRDCYYVNPDKAPEWWKPNETISELIDFKRTNDATFQGLIRGQSRTRSRTSILKQSHTPTPEIPDE